LPAPIMPIRNTERGCSAMHEAYVIGCAKKKGRIWRPLSWRVARLSQRGVDAL
jgi:hypothetical protein